MTLTVTVLHHFPLIQPGDPLGPILADVIDENHLTLQHGDILVLAQKIVSKSEGRIRRLSEIAPGDEAIVLAGQSNKDARFVQAILDESRKVLRVRSGTIIVEHRNGCVCANAGIDRSNLEQNEAHDRILLLPVDPDASAERIRTALEFRFNVNLGVMIIDSFGRAWRNGVIGTCIGISNVPGLVDLRGEPDLFGTELRVTQVAAADQLAAVASLLMGEANEMTPVAHVRGFPYNLRPSTVKELLRDEIQDLFR